MEFQDDTLVGSIQTARDEGMAKAKALEKLDLNILRRGLLVDVEWFRVLAQSLLTNKTNHSHSGIEIHFLMEGTHEFGFDNGLVHLGPGQGIVVPPNRRHQLYNTGGQFMRYVINCALTVTSDEPEALFLRDALCLDDVWRFDITREMADLLRDCVNEAVDAVNGYVMMIENNVLRILLLLARARAGRNKAEYRAARMDTFSRQTAEEMKAFIEENAVYRLNVTDVSKHMYMSAKQVQRIYKQEYGVTVYQAISLRRLSKAKELLRDTSLTIAEVSARLEFSTEQSFCRFFRKLEGQTPDGYRRGALGNE